MFSQFHKIANDSVAQLVEQYTFNVWVLGSSPSGITKEKAIAFAKAMAFFTQKNNYNYRFRSSVGRAIHF